MGGGFKTPLRSEVCPPLQSLSRRAGPDASQLRPWTPRARLRARGPGASREWALLALEAPIGAITWLTLSPFTPALQQTSAEWKKGGGRLGTERFPRISPAPQHMKLR